MTLINTEISDEYKKSLIPFSIDTLSHLELPAELLSFFTSVGVPTSSHYNFNSNICISFFNPPIEKKHFRLKNRFLVFASLEEMGELAVDLQTQEVYQLIGEGIAPSYVNSSLPQFIQCLGAWLTFYSGLQKYVKCKVEEQPDFSLFESDKIFDPIIKKLKEIDSDAMKWRKYFWRRMCEPDIV